MASFGQKEPIHWCKANTGKTNPMKLKMKAISPAGVVTHISLATGKTITSTLNNPYAELKKLEKAGRDWVQYAECESGCEPVPAREPGVELCLSEHCDLCKKREALISSRVDAKNLKNGEYSKLFETRLDKLAEVIERGMVGNVRPVVPADQLAEVMTAEPPKKSAKPRSQAK